MLTDDECVDDEMGDPRSSSYVKIRIIWKLPLLGSLAVIALGVQLIRLLFTHCTANPLKFIQTSRPNCYIDRRWPTG